MGLVCHHQLPIYGRHKLLNGLPARIFHVVDKIRIHENAPIRDGRNNHQIMHWRDECPTLPDDGLENLPTLCLRTHAENAFTVRNGNRQLSVE